MEEGPVCVCLCEWNGVMEGGIGDDRLSEGGKRKTVRVRLVVVGRQCAD